MYIYSIHIIKKKKKRTYSQFNFIVVCICLSFVLVDTLYKSNNDSLKKKKKPEMVHECNGFLFQSSDNVLHNPKRKRHYNKNATHETPFFSYVCIVRTCFSFAYFIRAPMLPHFS